MQTWSMSGTILTRDNLNMITIARLRRAGKKQLDEVNRLSSQLSRAGGKTTLREFKIIMEDPNYMFFVARDATRIVGIAQLVLMRTPVGIRGRAESVVVDEAYRGKGIGTALMKKIIAAARKGRAHSLSLTSNPARKEANKLYPALGFKLRKTNSYKMTF